MSSSSESISISFSYDKSGGLLYFEVVFRSSSSSSSSESIISSSSSSESSSSESSSYSESISSSSSQSFTVSAGLYLADYDNPTLATLEYVPELRDGDIYTVYTTTSRKTSWGVDVQRELTLSYIDTHFFSGNGIPESWYRTDTFELYISNNNVNWTLIETFVDPPILDAITNYCRVRFSFTTPQTARYFKIRNANETYAVGVINVGGGSALLGVSEIEYG